MAAESTVDETLAIFEEAFSNRYTDDDAEYMKAVNKTLPPPPCIIDTGYGRGFQGRDDRRDRYGQGQGRDRYHPYQRNDRQGGGRVDDRHGNRYDNRTRYERKRPATEYGSQGYFQYYY